MCLEVRNKLIYGSINIMVFQQKKCQHNSLIGWNCLLEFSF